MTKTGPGQDTIMVAREAHLTIVSIARPEVMNALGAREQRWLTEIFDAFEADPDQWIGILTGVGDRAFCAGHDLRQEAAGMERGIGEAGFGGLTRRFGRTKPIIAAVNGVAIGGGFEMALACELIVASDNASFALPEPRIGFAALSGGIARLIRAVGEKRAMEIVLTTRAVPAAEALALGFVNKVVPQGETLTAARALAEMILLASPCSIQASIAAARHDAGGELREAMRTVWDLDAVKAMQASPDFVEGPRAFAERRSPQWVGPNGWHTSAAALQLTSK